MLDKLIGLWPYSPLIFLLCFIAMCSVIQWMERREKRRQPAMCHWCKQEHGSYLKKCNTCGEHNYFCADHKYHLNLIPRCEGVYVGHDSGHRYSLKRPGTCAGCGLARIFWGMWHCSPGVANLNNERILNNLHNLSTDFHREVRIGDSHQHEGLKVNITRAEANKQIPLEPMPSKLIQ